MRLIKLSRKKNGELLAIPLSSHRQYTTDVQLNLSEVLRNDAQTWICLSCIRLIRTTDLLQYVCTISDHQLETINHQMLKILMNQCEEPKVEPSVRTVEKESSDAGLTLIHAFITERVIPNNRHDQVGCHGTNVWSAWRCWLKEHKMHPDLVGIQEFGRLFIYARGNLENERNMLQTMPFSRIPFPFKIRDGRMISQVPTPPSVSPEKMVTEAIHEVIHPKNLSNGSQNTELVKTLPRETIVVGPDEITIDKDDYKSLSSRGNRGYFVIRDKRSIGIMGQMKVEPSDRILCFTPNKKKMPLLFTCEQDIRDLCQYYSNHSMDDTAQKFGITGSTVTRTFAAVKDWAGYERRGTRVTSVGKPVRGNNAPPPDEPMQLTIPTTSPEEKDKKDEKPTVSVANPLTVSNIDAKVNYAAHLISSFMEAEDTYNLAQRYELNHLVTIPEALFYRKIRTSAYFAIGELLGLKRDGNVYLSDDREIAQDDQFLKTYQFLETIHTDPMFAMKTAIKTKIAKMRAIFGPRFGLNKEFSSKFQEKMLAHMNLTEDGADVLTSMVKEYFCEQDIRPIEN